MGDMSPEGIWGTGVFSAFELKSLTKPSIVTCSALNGRPSLPPVLRKSERTPWISALSSNNSPLDGSLPSSPPPSAVAAVKALVESECHLAATTSGGQLRPPQSIPQVGAVVTVGMNSEPKQSALAFSAVDNEVINEAGMPLVILLQAARMRKFGGLSNVVRKVAGAAVCMEKI
ncbi:unnamed protein product [Nippostrongylus brasiliensis]|uniref:Ribosomal_L18e/L15P domain-containing protein n=1 Tax=Nippostrongylus brasiliensis TaxID=27835 RepID=A0A0N4XRH5_NIPBR|nr:unnamed protein product [Nippostrongylus brasiliensis]